MYRRTYSGAIEKVFSTEIGTGIANSIGEGFGLPVLEAMYFGKPVFLSRSTSLPEVGGDVAYYFGDFEPASMKEAFESGMHHYQCKHPNEKIIERAKSFSWKNAAEGYLNVYRKFL